MNYEKSLSVEDDLIEFANKETRITALKVLRGVVLSTPVDTGRAKGNWRVGVNVDPTEEINREDKAGAITISVGAGQIESAKGIGLAEIFVSNNLPYIERLNDGYSAQAPAKFVEKAIAQAKK